MSAAAFTGVSAAGGIMSAFGQYKAGKQEQTAYEYNATLSGQNAAAIRASEKLNQQLKTKQLRADIGEQRAAYAGRGVRVDTGSPIDVMVNSLSNGYMDMAIDKYNSEVAARSAEAQGEMYRFYGKQAASAGKYAAIGSLLQTAGSFGGKFVGSKTTTPKSTSFVTTGNTMTDLLPGYQKAY